MTTNERELLTRMTGLARDIVHEHVPPEDRAALFIRIANIERALPPPPEPHGEKAEGADKYEPVLDEEGNETGYHRDVATGEVVTLADEYDEQDDVHVTPEEIAADNAAAEKEGSPPASAVAESALRAAVVMARNTFEAYAALHREKGTPEGDAKAALNDELAKHMNHALKSAPQPPAPATPDRDTSSAVSDAMVKHMVNRFLGWRLPKPWHPDNGISYARPNYAHPPADHDWPVGTNLFDATQAEAMVRYMLASSPAAPAPVESEKDHG